MPYIRKEYRWDMMELGEKPKDPGQLNYAISRMVSAYLKEHGLCYQTLHDVVGVMRDVATEVERRFIGPYEDKKKVVNGEVFEEVVEEMKKQGLET